MDTVIIGGGIIGLAIGYFLSKRNHCNLEIVERENQLTMHASGHNAGGLSSAHPLQPRELWPLYSQSQKLYVELSNTSGFDFDYKIGGSVLLGTESDEMQFRFLSQAHADREYDINVEYLDRGELEQKEPYVSKRYSCALFHPLDAQGNSLKLAESLRRFCVEKGVMISTGSTVRGFEIAGNKVVSLHTNNGTISPKSIVVAAGPWSGGISELMGKNLPVTPVKGHLITIETGGLKLVNSFVTGSGYYAMQNGSAIVVGGGEDKDGFNSRIIPERIREALSEGISMIPQIQDLNISRAIKTACLRPFSGDGVPIIGRSRKLSNVYYATGHFRNGFGLAPVTGEIISQLIIDQVSELATPYISPGRF